MHPPMPLHIKTLACLIVALGAAACDGESRREAERAAQAHHAQMVAVTGQLQSVDAELSAIAQALAQVQHSMDQHRAEHDDLQQQMARLEREAEAFMLANKMAVAALALGVGGGAVALDDSGRFTQDARDAATVVGVAAVAYALFNTAEVMHVADVLMRLEVMAQSLTERLQTAESALSAARAEGQSVLARRAALGAQADGLRVQLQTLQEQAPRR